MIVHPLLEARSVSKRFPGNGVQAVDAADLVVASGEVRAVIGENGAGKTTLMHILAGVLEADSGSVALHGAPIANGDSAAARAAGVVMSYQHPRLDRSLTVLENLFLGDEPRRFGLFFDRSAARKLVRTVAPDFSGQLFQRRLATLSSGQIRMVSLIAALLRLPGHQAGVLILDEPTEATTPDEADRIFEIIRHTAESGHGVVFISHKLPEVGRIADTVTVLRAGRTVATFSGDADVALLAEAMVGEADPSLASAAVSPGTGPAPVVDERLPPRLQLDRVTVRAGNRALLHEICLSVYPGEIVGLIGIRENGVEAMEALLAGTLTPASGRMEVDGRVVAEPSPDRFRALGLRYVPTDRLLRGASVDSSVADNLIALKRRHFQRAGVLDATDISRFTASLRARYGIEAAPHAPLWQLSGGNIQKVILSRELEGDPHLLVICEPGWGLDFRARSRVVEQIRAVARDGAAVIVITTDIDEVYGLADRIAVLFDGRIIARFPRESATRQGLGRAMAGAGVPA